MTQRFDLIRKNILAMVALGALVLGAVLLIWSPASAQNSGSSSPLGKAQLEQLVAPIALYPDDLMSQVLMASTYPLEVVEAARWSRDNKSVSGKALEDAMTKQSWDPSVKALAAVPQTLEMMNDKLTWTQQLGDAFLAQQQDVLDAVQRLRQRAEDAGNLKTTPQQVVRKTSESTTTGSASAEPAVIAIAPTDPEMLYVPVYDPGVVYGDWPYADYQPFYWYPSGFVASNVLSFATGVAVGAAIWGNIDWRRRNVNINVDRYNQFNHTRIASNDWNHNPAHRGVVPYRDRNVSEKFGGAQKAAAREGFRDSADAGRRDLSNNPAAKNAAKNTTKNATRNANQKVAAHHPGGQQPQRANSAQRDKQVGQKPHSKPTAQKRTGASNSAAARPNNLNRPNVAGGANVRHAQNFHLAGSGPRVSAGARAGGGGRAARGGGGGRRR